MLSFILVLFVSFMLPGVIARTRALFSGRKGVKFFQHVNNISVQARKASVYSPVTSILFRIAPSVYLGSIFTATLFIPVGSHGSLISFNGDIVLFCYLLALSRFSLIIAALDTGSSFEGMGASREALYGALIEPAIFTILGTLALVSGHTSFHSIFANMSANSSQMVLVMILILYATIKIILVESGRIPVDDPKTHLELTMIHEVMILDFTGIDIAYISIGNWIKTGIFTILGANAFACSFSWGWPIAILIALSQGIIIGTIESFMARNRLSRNSTYMLTILAIGLVIFTVCFLLSHNINIG